MTKTIESLFVFLATYFPLLPISAFLFKNRFTSPYSKALTTVICYSVVELITNVLVVEVFENKAISITYSVFTIFEYLLFAGTLFFLIGNKFIKKIIIALSICFILFATFYFIYTRYKALDTIPIGIETILILSFCFYFFYEQMENTTTLIYYRYDFWIVAGILIYLAGSFFIYVYSNELDGPTRETFWMFTNIFTVIKHIAFFIAVLSFSKPINNKFSKINPYHN